MVVFRCFSLQVVMILTPDSSMRRITWRQENGLCDDEQKYFRCRAVSKRCWATLVLEDRTMPPTYDEYLVWHYAVKTLSPPDDVHIKSTTTHYQPTSFRHHRSSQK
jgi:hypothetical protein